MKPSKSSFPGGSASYHIQIPSASSFSINTANGSKQPAGATAGTISWTGSATTMWIPRGISSMTSTASMTKGFEYSRWKDRRVATVQKGAAHYIIQGWAVDPWRLSQVDSLQIGIGRTFRQAVSTPARTDFPPILGLSGSLNLLLPLEWECNFDDQDLIPGCHDIQLSIGEPGAIKTVIHTRIQLCIEDSGK